jgi:hypothetical protein
MLFYLPIDYWEIFMWKCDFKYLHKNYGEKSRILKGGKRKETNRKKRLGQNTQCDFIFKPKY